MSEVKAPKIKIESNGTSTGTHVFIDGIEVTNLESVKFEAKINKTLTKLNLTYVYPSEANLDADA